MVKKISPKALLDLNVRNERQKSPSESSKKPILAIDYGEKYCGLAISPDGHTVLPAAVVQRDRLEGAIDSMVKDYSIEVMVIGLTLSSDGSQNHVCEQINKMVKHLTQKYRKIKIELVNERFSSQAVLSEDKARIDDLAAMQILEFYLAQK